MNLVVWRLFLETKLPVAAALDPPAPPLDPKVEVAVMAATAGAPVINQNAACDWLTAFPHYVASLWAADDARHELGNELFRIVAHWHMPTPRQHDEPRLRQQSPGAAHLPIGVSRSRRPQMIVVDTLSRGRSGSDTSANSAT